MRGGRTAVSNLNFDIGLLPGFRLVRFPLHVAIDGLLIVGDPPWKVY